jgi:hypothetical protein
MELQTMYPAGNSLFDVLPSDISTILENIPVNDLNFFPDAPNYITIGVGNDAEVILYNSKDTANNALAGCVRGQSGTVAQSWQAGEKIYHSFTSELMNRTISNINALNQGLSQAPSPNLLINGNFVVWQRGTSFAAPANAYTADRWKANGSGTVSRTGANGGMTISGSVTLSYTMETLDFAGISGKTVTLTWSQGGNIQYETFTATNAMIFSKTLSSTTLEWVWLNMGNYQVNNPTWRPYAQEQILCQRYLFIPNLGYYCSTIANATASALQVFIPCAAPLRITPTANPTITGSIRVPTGAYSFTLTPTTITAANHGIMLTGSISPAAGTLPNYAGFITNLSKFSLDAEIY